MGSITPRTSTTTSGWTSTTTTTPTTTTTIQERKVLFFLFVLMLFLREFLLIHNYYYYSFTNNRNNNNHNHHDDEHNLIVQEILSWSTTKEETTIMTPTMTTSIKEEKKRTTKPIIVLPPDFVPYDDSMMTTTTTTTTTTSNHQKMVTTTATTVQNTNWGNIQYNSGYFNFHEKPLEEYEHSIMNACGLHDAFVTQWQVPREIYDSHCAVPLVTNYTCCYCYFIEYPIFLDDDPDRNYNNNNNNNNNNNTITSSTTTSTTTTTTRRRRRTIQDWSNHAVALEPYKNRNAWDATFWFCAEQRSHSLYHATDWTTIDFGNNNNNNFVDVAVNDTNDNDDSTETTKKQQQNPNLILVTAKLGYDNKYQKDIDLFCQQAITIGFFRERDKDIFCYSTLPDFILQNKTIIDMYARHMKFLTDPNDVSARGGGYWFFKGILLQYHIYHTCKDGDYLIWLDEDRIDFIHQGPFNVAIETLNQRNDDMLVETMLIYQEERYNKEMILNAFNATESMRLSPQLNANSLVMKVSHKSKKFIDAFVECMSDWHMVADDEPIVPNIPGIFQDNRHDQAIVSILVKRFLIRQGPVGPPIRPYHPRSQHDTYRFPNNDLYPFCPFEDYYARIGKYPPNHRHHHGQQQQQQQPSSP